MNQGNKTHAEDPNQFTGIRCQKVILKWHSEYKWNNWTSSFNTYWINSQKPNQNDECTYAASYKNLCHLHLEFSNKKQIGKEVKSFKVDWACNTKSSLLWKSWLSTKMIQLRNLIIFFRDPHKSWTKNLWWKKKGTKIVTKAVSVVKQSELWRKKTLVINSIYKNAEWYNRFYNCLKGTKLKNSNKCNTNPTLLGDADQSYTRTQSKAPKLQTLLIKADLKSIKILSIISP